MDNRELTDEQISDLVHYLKSWGIDEPMLLAEMTDHYGDKALEIMGTGKTLEEVLNSWRTKSMYRTLRQIDANYKEYSKKDWRRKHWKIFKELITPRNVFIFLMVFISIFFILQMKYVASIFLGLLTVKAVLILGFIGYHYTFNKLKRRLYTPTTIGILWFGNYLFFNSFAKEFFNFPEPAANHPLPALVLASVICAILVSDVVLFRVWNYITQTSGHITKEMLTEWEVPKSK